MPRSDMGAGFRKIKKLASKQGWVVDQTSRGHWQFKPPNGGEIVVTSWSPSDHRSILNFTARLRKGGLRGV